MRELHRRIPQGRITGILPFSERLYRLFVHSHGAAELPFARWWSSRPRKLRSACRVPPIWGPPHNISVPSHATSPIAAELRKAPGLFMKEDVMNRLEKVLYTAKAHTTGGRAGMSRSSDRCLEGEPSRPGNPGPGT